MDGGALVGGPGAPVGPLAVGPRGPWAVCAGLSLLLSLLLLLLLG